MPRTSKHNLENAKRLYITEEQYKRLMTRHAQNWQEHVRDMIQRYLESLERMGVPTLYAEDAE